MNVLGQEKAFLSYRLRIIFSNPHCLGNGFAYTSIPCTGALGIRLTPRACQKIVGNIWAVHAVVFF